MGTPVTGAKATAPAGAWASAGGGSIMSNKAAAGTYLMSASRMAGNLRDSRQSEPEYKTNVGIGGSGGDDECRSRPCYKARVNQQTSNDPKRRILKDVFGFDDFRPGQAMAMDSLLAGGPSL